MHPNHRQWTMDDGPLLISDMLIHPNHGQWTMDDGPLLINDMLMHPNHGPWSMVYRPIVYRPSVYSPLMINTFVVVRAFDVKVIPLLKGKAGPDGVKVTFTKPFSPLLIGVFV